MTLAALAGCNETRAIEAVSTFDGLPHRLQPVPCSANRRCYDDSASTTPESTAAALNAIDEPIWLLTGGKDKGMDVDTLVDAVLQKAAGAACFGSVAEDLFRRLRAKSPDFPSAALETLEEAVAWTVSQSHEGDAVLLSPGFASTDQFVNYTWTARLVG